MGVFREIDNHPFRHVNAGEIFVRISRSRGEYEERQRRKMLKGLIEEESKRKDETGNQGANVNQKEGE
jgi:ethanolamine-phosphate cytidylyltransferase